MSVEESQEGIEEDSEQDDVVDILMINGLLFEDVLHDPQGDIISITGTDDTNILGAEAVHHTTAELVSLSEGDGAKLYSSNVAAVFR